MAYGAAVSLNQTIQILVRDSKYDTRLPKSQVEFISNELSYLGSFLKTIRLFPRKAAADERLENRVQFAVQKLDGLISSYKDRFQPGHETRSSTEDDDDGCLTFSRISQKLPKIRQKIDSFWDALKTNEEYKRREEQSRCNFASTTSGFIRKEKMAGLQDQLKQLKDLVLRETRKDRLILVKGMTGIGKTTLVQEIYKDPLVEENFDAYLFLSFGPVYQLKEILLLALFQLGVHSGNFHENGSVEQLQGYVKEFLSYKRYLIVLDNVWDGSAFEELCDNILPHEEMSSCVIFTSQTISLSSSYYHCTESLHIRFLDDEESWNLLHEMVFTSDRECCDRRLEKIGRKIAKNCDGLPLAIIQVGELLRKTKKTVDIWEEIAEKEDPLTISMEDDTPLSNSLSLSYTMLPQYLKLCFLYMCVFPKNYKISRSKLIQLWVSEGFIQKKNLEETAGGYLDELVSQSCVLSEELRSIHLRQTKTCRLHFTFRSLCVSEAKRTNFSHFVRKYIDCFPESIDNQQQRLCIHNNVVLGFKQVHQWIKSVKDARSLLCFGPLQQYPIILHLPYGLLKVLDVLAIRFYEFPHQVLDLIQLRYLAITCDEEIPPSVSRLLNLESLVLLKHHNIKWSKNVPVYLPIEIWKLSKLKHLQCMGLDLPDPSIDDSLSLGRLLTLSGVSAHSCTHRVLARMPMLKRIGIKIDSANDSIETAFSLVGDFTALNHNFESFKCMVMYPNLLRSQVIPSHPNFPKNVRKISLGGCGFPWKYMRVIGALPSLQVLKVRCNAFCGPEWKIDEIEEEKQFHSLEYLLLEDLDLEDMGIQHSVEYDRCFRELKRLVIRHCYKLQEIPSILMWVDLIEVDNCSLSLEKQIQDWRSTEGRHEFLIKSAREDKN